MGRGGERGGGARMGTGVGGYTRLRVGVDYAWCLVVGATSNAVESMKTFQALGGLA